MRAWYRRYFRIAELVTKRSNRALESGCIGFCLFVFFGCASAQEVAYKKIISLDDLTGLHSAQGMQLDPDGQRLIYQDEHDGIFTIEVKAGAKPHKITEGSNPAWSPDGKKIAYYKNAHGIGHRQLWIYDFALHSARQITKFPGGIDPDIRTTFLFFDAVSFSWSPDSQKIAFGSRTGALGFNTAGMDILYRRNEPRSKSRQSDSGMPLIFTNSTPYGGTLAGVLPGWHMPPAEPSRINQVYVVDTNSGVIKLLTQGNRGCATPDWSPDGKSIICTSLEGREPDGYGPPTTNIVVVDVATGARRAITSGDGRKLNPKWSPNGKYVAYIEESGGHALGGAASIAVVTQSGGAPMRILDDSSYDSVHRFQWWQDGESLIFEPSGADEILTRYFVGDGHISKIGGDHKGVIAGLSVSKNGQIAWLSNSPVNPSTIQILPTIGASQSFELFDFNPQVKTWRIGAQEIVRWKNGHGEQREGILIKPAGYVEGKKYPLIVDPYPFRGNSFKGSPLLGNQAWASRGYVVFFPNPRLPYLWMQQRSIDLQEKSRGAKGWAIAVDDIMSGVTDLIDQSIVDPKRMCLYGMSNGGGAVNYLVTASDEFKCAVSVAGIMSDWPLVALLGSDTANSVFDEVAGGSIWDDPNNYIQGSPVYRLNRVKTPLLLAGGDLDGFVILMNNEMYLGLRRLGRDVTMLRYPTQGHAFEGEALKDFWGRESDFFSKYLDEEVSAH